MKSSPRQDAPAPPTSPDRRDEASDDGLLTSEDLFWEMVDAPPDALDASARGRSREKPIRVQVAEPKFREDADDAADGAPAAPASPLADAEVSALLDIFETPPSSGAPAEAAPTPAASDIPPPAPEPPAPEPPAPEPPAPRPAAAPPRRSPAARDALERLDELAGARAPRRDAGSRLFEDAAEFESLLDDVLSPPAPDGAAEGEPTPATPAARVQVRPARPVREDTVDLLGVAAGAFDAAASARPGSARDAATRRAYGPYRLLERIATGGMAEVFRAKRSGVEGFEKVVAVKRILPHLSGNKEFVDMFVDEAKMVAGLTHPNIVQIYDLGRLGPSYFIALEYVHGRDLRTIQKRAGGRGARIPLDLAALVVHRVCLALEYAHRKKDARGVPMQIVHRDVSPQNILISFEGEVKLTDFGIAKAASKATITDRGSLRGKLFYMSPEQASGQPIDRRSDLFALGIVFYELVTGERPFTAGSERSILEAVRDCRIKPPRALNPRIPAPLEAVVLKALERDPDERYQDAAAMARDIERVLRERRLPAASDLARLMELLFDEHERGEGGEGGAAEREAGSASGDIHVDFDGPPSEGGQGASDHGSIDALMKRFGTGH